MKAALDNADHLLQKPRSSAENLPERSLNWPIFEIDLFR